MKRIENPKEFEIAQFDGVNSAAVYIGSMTDLVKVTEKLKWREDKEIGALVYEPYLVLTLDEIAVQLGSKYPLVTVIIEGPLSGAIFRYGNYDDDSWWQIGDLDGYA